jgi:DNA replication protein DnaC
LVDRQEAILKFVKQNIKLFLADDFYEKVYLENKRKFFDPIRMQIGIVKDSEIASSVIDFLFKTKQVKDSGFLDSIFRKDFFRKNIANSDYYYQRLSLERSDVDVDLRALEREDYKAEKINELTDRAIRENSGKIEEAIRKKQEEYLSIPSVLDEKDYPEPLDSEIDDSRKTNHQHWYKQLDLRQNPFPSIDGLEKISEDDYDDIIIRTDIYEKIVNYIRDTPAELFNSIVIYGQFGSGKTTLFQYIKKPLITNKIFPVYIRLSAQSDFQNFLIRFKQRLFQELRKIYRNTSGMEFREEYQAPLDDKISSVLRNLITSPHRCEGIIIFVDEIYKVPHYERVALDFVSHLQTFRGELIEELAFSNIGVWVSAPPYWQQTLTHELTYSGSVSGELSMPMITMNEALEMLNRRFRTFSKNQDKVREFQIAYIQQVYRRLQSTNSLTFRQFIKEILYQLNNGNFDTLVYNPVAIPEDIINQIRSRFDYADTVSLGIKQILNSTLSVRNKTICFKLLIKTVQMDEIAEESSLFREHLFHFQTLRNARLVVKVKKESGLSVWKASMELLSFVNWIRTDFHYFLEDYFFKIYGTQLSPNDEDVHFVREEISSCQYLLDEIRNQKEFRTIHSLIETAFETHKRIVEKLESPKIDVDQTALTEDCKLSMIALTQAIALFYGVKETVSLSFWSRFWNIPDSVSTFVRMVSDDGKTDHRFDMDFDKTDPKIWYVTSSYSAAFSDTIFFLSQQIERSRILSIPIKNLRQNEVREFDKARDHFANRDYFEAVSIVSRVVEMKLRDVLYHVFILQYGEQFKRLRRIPDEQRKSINSNNEKDKKQGLSISDNECLYLNRHDYKVVLMGPNASIGQKNWKHTFSKLLHKWKESELLEFLDNFASHNLNAGHNKDKVFTIDQQNKVYSLMIKSIELVGMINNAYQIMIKSIRKVDTGGTPRFAYYFSMDGADIAELSPVHVTTSDAERIINIWKRDAETYIDLADKEQIEYKYGVKYQEFCAVLGAILKLNEDTKTRINARVINENGSEILLRVE